MLRLMCCKTAFHLNIKGVFFVNIYLWVLIGSHCGEGRLWEGESLKWAPADSVRTVCLDDVKPWVIAMHGVQDDLMREKGKMSKMYSEVKCKRNIII